MFDKFTDRARNLMGPILLELLIIYYYFIFPGEPIHFDSIEDFELYFQNQIESCNRILAELLEKYPASESLSQRA